MPALLIYTTDTLEEAIYTVETNFLGFSGGHIEASEVDASMAQGLELIFLSDHANDWKQETTISLLKQLRDAAVLRAEHDAVMAEIAE